MIKVKVNKSNGWKGEIFFRDKERASSYIENRIKKFGHRQKLNGVKFMTESYHTPKAKKETIISYKGEWESFLLEKGEYM